MLQFDTTPSRFRENVGQQVANPSASPRYRNMNIASQHGKMDVASQPVCDVVGLNS